MKWGKPSVNNSAKLWLNIQVFSAISWCMCLLNANYNIEMQIQLNTPTDIGHLMLIGENSKTSL